MAPTIGVSRQYSVEYDIVKPAPKDRAGNANVYHRGHATVDLVSDSPHPKDILAVLKRNIELSDGEQFEILQIKARDWGQNWFGVLT